MEVGQTRPVFRVNTSVAPGAAGKLVRDLIAASPYHIALGVELAEVDEVHGQVRIVLGHRKIHEREPQSGRHHGGVIAALVDVAGTFAAIALIGRNAPTTSLSVDFLRPPTPFSQLLAVGQVRQAGRTVGRADVDVTDGDGRLVAIGRVRLSWNPIDDASART